ncbi:unnamed protein product [Trichogramma brassicae]|uniref:Uncharacterized protein n=1 Tax=Trichogramma brassicae TaxID=86971 RepID=A0A6H5IZN6_9HYME|nr:unnamed protein product [Trichogramma brassicae]
MIARIGTDGGVNETHLVEFLLRRGADPNVVDKYGYTPLHIILASKSPTQNEEEFVEVFFNINDEIQQTVHIDVQNDVGETPLYYAVYWKYLKTSEYLLRRGAKPGLADKNRSTPLHLLSEMNDSIDLAKMLFEFSKDEIWWSSGKMNVNAQDVWGRTSLYLAVRSNNKKVAKLLLKKGADPNLATAVARWTPLHLINFLIEGDSIYGPKTLFLRKKVPGTQRFQVIGFEAMQQIDVAFQACRIQGERTSKPMCKVLWVQQMGNLVYGLIKWPKPDTFACATDTKFANRSAQLHTNTAQKLHNGERASLLHLCLFRTSPVHLTVIRGSGTRSVVFFLQHRPDRFLLLLRRDPDNSSFDNSSYDSSSATTHPRQFILGDYSSATIHPH